jgi:hypothetical protein
VDGPELHEGALGELVHAFALHNFLTAHGFEIKLCISSGWNLIKLIKKPARAVTTVNFILKPEMDDLS